MRYEKAQIAGQIFIYIFSIIVVALVLLYGYNAIQDFRKKADEVSLINFKNEIENVVAKSMRAGDVKPVELSLSGRYQKVCFVDSYSAGINEDNTCLCQAGCSDYDAVICDAWKTTGVSVLLVPLSEIPINIGSITVDGNDDGSEDTAPCSNDECYLCVPVKNAKISLILYGKGDHILIKEKK